jgi:hypothetical protein
MECKDTPEDLQNNSLIFSDLDSVPETLCSNCDRISKADFWCQDCNLDFCTQCYNISHKLKAFQSHTILSTAQKSKIISYADCERHRPEKLKSFCSDCALLVCIYCIIDQHKQHNVIAVEKKINDMQETITATAKQFLSDASREGAWNGVEEFQLERKKSLESEILELKRKLESLEMSLLQTDQSIEKIRERKKCVISNSLHVISNVQNISSYEKLSSLNQKYLRYMQNIEDDVDPKAGDDNNINDDVDDPTMFAIGEATKSYTGYSILISADEINKRKEEMNQFYRRYSGFYVLDSFTVTNTFATKSKWLLSVNRNYMVPIGYIKREYNLIQGSYKGICELHRRENTVFTSIGTVLDGGFYGRVAGIPALFVKDPVDLRPNTNI